MMSITQENLNQLIATGKILEQDKLGVKVVKLDNNHYLKIFNHRKKISKSNIFCRSKRFERNALKLKRRGINTVEPTQVFKIKDSARDCIIYRGVDGNTVRQELEKNLQKDPLSKKLGKYIAQLHETGIMFRSLHFGNIICCPNDNFALIDIDDMRVNIFKLYKKQRLRNFAHIFRYQIDYKNLDLNSFIQGYCKGQTTQYFNEIEIRKIIRELVSRNDLR